MTQQLSMERAELERAKVRWGRHLQVLFACPVSLTGVALRCVVEEGAGCWVLGCSILPLPPQSPARLHGESQSDQPSGTWMREAAVCVHDARWFPEERGVRAFHAGFPPPATGLNQPLDFALGLVAEMG